MHKGLIRGSVAVVFIFTMATSAFAQATRTWVSGVGDDANPCSRTAPCKTFAGAISKTATAGEINVLDPGGFGAVTITKSITIDGGDGPMSSILASGTSGVIFNPALAGSFVTLRNIEINGASTTAGAGIRMLSAGTMNIENCRIYGFTGTTGITGRGLSVETTNGNNKIFIRNTVFRNNNIGTLLAPSGAFTTTVSVESSSFVNNAQEGFRAGGAVSANLARSDFSNNGGAGVQAENTAEIALFASQVHRNSSGIVSSGAGTRVRIFASSVTYNTSNGLLASLSGEILTHNNNQIIANGGNQTPTGSSNQQ